MLNRLKQRLTPRQRLYARKLPSRLLAWAMDATCSEHCSIYWTTDGLTKTSRSDVMLPDDIGKLARRACLTCLSGLYSNGL